MHAMIPGVELRNADEDAELAVRPIRQRNIQHERNAYLRLAHLFRSSPQELLQELVDLSINLCGAESAGISLLEGDTFRWVATGGRFSPLRDSMLPETVSPCGICLQRDKPQVFSVSNAYYTFLNIPGPVFTNGLLIPWHSDDTHGTLWVIPFKNSRGFDAEDLRLVEGLAEMVALSVRTQRSQQRLHDRDLIDARTTLAHEIHTPLLDIANALEIASERNPDLQLGHALTEVQRLSELVAPLLNPPQIKSS